ncbi:MAG: hypothetical protein LBD12_04735, partial [Clostridiales Family XIII bacterium]|nr:hypothetical protein [Clostridiales Family XIII bacterium]
SEEGEAWELDFYAFTGWAGSDSTFAEHSAEYAKSLADYQKTSDEFRRQAELSRKKRSAKEKGTNLFLCVGGAAFVAVSVLMIASGRGIAIGIAGLLFGGIGVFMGVSNLKG